MEETAQPYFMVSPMRVLTLPAITFFHAAGEPVPFSELDRQLDLLLERLYQAKRQAGIEPVGPDITRYYPSPAHPGLFIMEVGVALPNGAQPAGEALVKVLPPFHCAAVLLWGGLDHSGQAYEALARGMSAQGLAHSGETREINYAFEAVFSPNNLMGIYQSL